MPPARVRSKVHGLSSIVLVCLCLTVLVVSIMRRSTPVVTETAASEGLVQITPGTPMPGEITAGGKAVFAVSGNADTLLRFSIHKGDLALTTVVYGPTNARLLEHASEDFENVEVSVPVDISGTYTIEIQSREKAAIPRRYQLSVEPFTSLTLTRRQDSEARLAMATAGVLRANWTQASLRQSIGEYDKAALLWTSIGNFSNASQATLRSGELHFLLSEYSEALKQFQNAAASSAKTGDRVG